MEFNRKINLSRRKNSSRLIVEAAITRGWSIAGFDSDPAVFLIDIPGKSQAVQIYSASPPQTSYAAARIADNKYIVNQLLSYNKFPVPEEIVLRYSDISSSKNQLRIKKFIKSHSKFVVKPLDAAHGKGITLNVTAVSLAAALERASQGSKDGQILIQQQIDGYDIRIVCIDNKYADAITRIPASVTGDGQRTISQLIDLTNQKRRRKSHAQSMLSPIPKNLVRDYLGKEAMQTTPPLGKNVRVLGVSNTSMGGQRINIKDQIPGFLQKLACDASKTLRLPVCGVDIIVAAQPSPASTKKQLKPYIIEANWCPSLVMYEDVNSPGQRALIDKFLDYLAS